MKNQQAEIIEFQEIEIVAQVDDTHNWLIPTKHVAEGYGCSESTIRKHMERHSDEIEEDTHFIRVTNCHANPRGGEAHQKTMWTPKGIIMLGFFIKSERAKAFRAFAADRLLEPRDVNKELPDLKRIQAAGAFLRHATGLMKSLPMRDADKLELIDTLCQRELGYSLNITKGLLNMEPEDEVKVFAERLKQKDYALIENLPDKKLAAVIKQGFAEGFLPQPAVCDLFRAWFNEPDASSKNVSKRMRDALPDTFDITRKRGGRKGFRI